MSSCVMPMRGVMTEVGGVMGVIAGDGPSDSSTSLSGLSNETSSVASVTGQTKSSTVIEGSEMQQKKVQLKLKNHT